MQAIDLELTNAEVEVRQLEARLRVVPRDLSPEQKSLLRKVGGLTGKPEKVSKGFFEKLRDAINID